MNVDIIESCVEKCSEMPKSCVEKCSEMPKTCVEKCSEMAKSCVEKCSEMPKSCVEKCSGMPKTCVEKCSGMAKLCVEKCSFSLVRLVSPLLLEGDGGGFTSPTCSYLFSSPCAEECLAVRPGTWWLHCCRPLVAS